MTEEKVFTIPLRKVFRTSRNRRGKKAVALIRRFLERHMKGEVKIGKSINTSVWAKGIQKPPRRIRIHATKEGDIVYAELVGVEIKTGGLKKKEEKAKEKEEKIKKERRERKKKTLEQEIKEEKEASRGRTPERLEEKTKAEK